MVRLTRLWRTRHPRTFRDKVRYKMLRDHRPDIVLPYTMKPIVWGSLAARLEGTPRCHPLFTGLGYAFSEDAPRGKRRLHPATGDSRDPHAGMDQVPLAGCEAGGRDRLRGGVLQDVVQRRDADPGVGGAGLAGADHRAVGVSQPRTAMAAAGIDA